MRLIEEMINNKMNTLMAAVIPKEQVKGFLSLPLNEKVFGVKFFATLAGDEKVIELCQHCERVLAE